MSKQQKRGNICQILYHFVYLLFIIILLLIQLTRKYLYLNTLFFSGALLIDKIIRRGFIQYQKYANHWVH